MPSPGVREGSGLLSPPRLGCCRSPLDTVRLVEGSYRPKKALLAIVSGRVGAGLWDQAVSTAGLRDRALHTAGLIENSYSRDSAIQQTAVAQAGAGLWDQ